MANNNSSATELLLAAENLRELSSSKNYFTYSISDDIGVITRYMGGSEPTLEEKWNDIKKLIDTVGEKVTEILSITETKIIEYSDKVIYESNTQKESLDEVTKDIENTISTIEDI